MSLGTFGGHAPVRDGVPGGTGSPAAPDLLTEAREQLLPSTEGMPALTPQLAQYLAGYGANLVTNGSFESWASGTSSAPDGWTLTGAGASVARNTTSGQIQEGFAACNVTAALNTATDLGQSITISATQNTRLRGRPVTFACRVRSATASRVFVKLDDGVATASSRYHVGDSNFETLFVTLTVDSAATKIEASLEISSGASLTATFDGAKLEEGAQATAFSANPRDPFAQPRVSQASDTQTTTSATFTDMPNMSISTVIVDGTQSVLVSFSGNVQSNTAGQTVPMQLARDGTGLLSFFGATPLVLTDNTVSAFYFDSKPTAGNYTYDVDWRIASGTTATVKDRAICVLVIPTL